MSQQGTNLLYGHLWRLGLSLAQAGYLVRPCSSSALLVSTFLKTRSVPSSNCAATRQTALLVARSPRCTLLALQILPQNKRRQPLCCSQWTRVWPHSLRAAHTCFTSTSSGIGNSSSPLGPCTTAHAARYIPRGAAQDKVPEMPTTHLDFQELRGQRQCHRLWNGDYLLPNARLLAHHTQRPPRCRRSMVCCPEAAGGARKAATASHLVA